VNLCLPLRLKRMEMDGRIRDTAQDEVMNALESLARYPWRQPLLTVSTPPWTHPRLCSLSMEGGRQTESG
jgi:hypothetical protein